MTHEHGNVGVFVLWDGSPCTSRLESIESRGASFNGLLLLEFLDLLRLLCRRGGRAGIWLFEANL